MEAVAVKKGHIEEVNITRGIAMFLAVLGHALLSNDQGVQLYLFRFIYSFHMPLFFFISGYCNIGILKKNTWGEIGQSIRQRFCRLMVPYLTFGVVYVLLDIVGGKYRFSEFHVGRYLIDLLKGDNANWQLWTLYVLFTCFLLTALLKRFVKLPVMLGIALVLHVTMRILWTIPGLPGWMFYTVITKTAIDWFFFLAGMFLREHFDIFRRPRVKPLLLASGLVLLVGASVLWTVFSLPLLALLTAPLGTLLFSELSKYAVLHTKVKGVFALFGSYCMEIYIFANICQVLVRTVFFEMLGLPEVICIILSLLAGLFIPILICKYIVNKVYIFRAVCLGNFKKGGEKKHANDGAAEASPADAREEHS